MKGLLHRLAARAAGTAVSVRSEAHNAFNAIEIGLNVGVTSERSVEADGRAQVLIASSPLAQLRDGLQGTMPKSAIDAPSQRSQGSLSSLGPQSAHDARSDVRTASPPVTHAIELDPSPLLRSVNDMSRDADETIIHRVAPTAEAARRSARLEATSADRTQRPIDGPSLLLPLAASDSTPSVDPLGATPSMPQVRGPMSAVSSAMNKEPTEVHIHIGRIEVTAVREAAPPRSRPAPTPLPMSLDAYLAKRNRA